MSNTSRPFEGPSAGPAKPYLIRAIYEWSLDEGLTPQVMVDVNVSGVEAPVSYAKDGKIVLNLHPSSIRGLDIGNEYLLFSARFAGRAENITLPITAIMAIYARENGQGMVFQADGSGISSPHSFGNEAVRQQDAKTTGANAPGNAPRTGPNLKVVK